MRARNIKPGFFKNEELAELPALTRILFAGLWCMADREGRLEDRPKRIKAEVIPYDSLDTDKALQALHDHGFILRYCVDGTRIIQITNFSRHQNPHIREPKSAYPEPVPVRDEHDTSTVQAQCETGTGPADSLFLDSPSLIPDSGINTLSGKPDDAHPQNGHFPYSEIISSLNECSESKFTATNETTKRLIKARFKQGFTLEDFVSVITYKCGKWKSDPEMARFMRPQTLFGPKFEAYLNEAKRTPPGPRRFSKSTQQSIENLKNWRPPNAES